MLVVLNSFLSRIDINILFIYRAAALLLIYSTTVSTWTSHFSIAKVLQDRATSGKRLRLEKSLVAENALAALRRNIVAMKSTRMPGRPCNLKQHVQKLLEAVNGGMIPV